MKNPTNYTLFRDLGDHITRNVEKWKSKHCLPTIPPIMSQIFGLLAYPLSTKVSSHCNCLSADCGIVVWGCWSDGVHTRTCIALFSWEDACTLYNNVLLMIIDVMKLLKDVYKLPY